jgi:hypothetical protein
MQAGQRFSPFLMSQRFFENRPGSETAYLQHLERSAGGRLQVGDSLGRWMALELLAEGYAGVGTHGVTATVDPATLIS